jgi:hypothetical protein
MSHIAFTSSQDAKFRHLKKVDNQGFSSEE